MFNTNNHIKKAFTIIELLMSLGISALLLGGAAIAISVASQTVTVNDRLEQFSQSGRMVLGRMAREIRNASNVQVTGGSRVHIAFPAGSSVKWAEYELVSGQIIYLQNDGSSTTSHVLLGSSDEISVSSMSFTPASLDTTSDSPEAVNVRLVLSGDGESTTLSSSSWPRRHLAW